MGWTFTHREPGMSTKQFFEREFPETLVTHGEILASAMVDGTFYAAVRNRGSHPIRPGQVWCMVALTRRDRGYHNFGYKDMDEDMGPNEAKCPARVLDLLTPATSEYAISWRADCRRYNERLEAAKRIKPGTRIRFLRTFNFGDGFSGDTFILVDGSTFRVPGRGRYRIPGWQQFPFGIVPETCFLCGFPLAEHTNEESCIQSMPSEVAAAYGLPTA